MYKDKFHSNKKHNHLFYIMIVYTINIKLKYAIYKHYIMSVLFKMYIYMHGAVVGVF